MPSHPTPDRHPRRARHPALHPRPPRLHAVSQALHLGLIGLAGPIALAAALPARAQAVAGTPQTVEITASRTRAEQEKALQHSAPGQALTQGSLKAIQPQSVISQHVIANTAAPTANYTDIIAISPSVVSVDPNGPGMMETQGGPTIRGFQDGQYNVTFDGIPWGDSNDFTHHSTSYFMPQDLGAIVVDRGPGDATNIGPATFGGTVAVHSKDPLPDTTTTLYGSVGSFGTRLLGAEFDTGTLKDYGGVSGFFDYRQAKTDGYITGAGLRRENLFLKAVKPLAGDGRLSFVAMKNTLTQHYSFGATSYPYVAVQAAGQPVTGTLPGQVQVFGPNWGLNADPASQAFSGYNYDEISTDFEYVGLKTQVAGVSIDNKLYTYGYYHRGYNGSDPNGGNLNYGAGYGPAGSPGDGTFPAGAGSTNGTFYAPTDVAGQRMLMNYRSWGDTLRLAQPLGPGRLEYGLWIDRQSNDRYQYEIDWTNGGGFNAASQLAAADRLMHDTLTSVQPYLAYAWQPTPQLTVTPGVKVAHFSRSIDAPVNQKTQTALNYSQSWSKTLPSVDVHYQIDAGWSAYLQAAKGFLAPNLNLFYVTNPLVSDQGVVPESTTNYQVGTTWKSQALTLSADLYAIDFSNQVAARTVAGVKQFYNLGGTRYRGAEIEAAYYLGAGFSAYANAAYNQARQTDLGLQLAGVPKTTAALGLVYNDGPWYAAAVTKIVGARYGDISTDASGQPVGIYDFSRYSVTNLSANYTLPGGALLPAGSKIGVQVNNLFDKKDLYALAAYTANNVPLFFTIPGRGVMLNFSLRF
ncbi:MAG: TonB-dependent receptor [Burkholderiales bacterium]|nr:TonB-dependent receptor [Burkholderiales bacterium]